MSELRPISHGGSIGQASEGGAYNTPGLIAKLPSGGCVSERRRREDRGAAGAERGGYGRGCLLPLGEGSGERAVPPLQKIFEFLK